MGMAIGLGVGMTPTMGVQMAIAIPIAAIARQSKISAAIGCWLSNPVTLIPLYSATYTLGALVMGRALSPPDGFVETLTNWRLILSDILLPCWVGGLIAAIPVGIAGYWLTIQAVVAYRLKIRQRRLARMHRWKWDDDEGWKRVNREAD